MRTKTILAAAFVLPLIVVACNRNEPTSTAAKPTQDKQAMSPDKMIERSPSAAGTPSNSAPISPSDTQSNPAWQPSTPGSQPPAAGAKSTPSSEPTKSGY